MDLRGHGRSSAPEDITYTPRDFSADAAALLRHLNVPNVLVMGHSMGAVTASTLAVLEPALIKGIVLVDPPYWNLSAKMDAMMPGVVSHPDIVQWTLNYYPTLVVEDTPQWMKAWYLRRVEGMPSHVVRKCLEGMYGEGGLGRAEVSTEFVVGKRNVPRLAVYAKRDDAEKERGLGMGFGDEVVSMEGVGHWMHQAKSEEFNDLLGKWLQHSEKN